MSEAEARKVEHNRTSDPKAWKSRKASITLPSSLCWYLRRPTPPQFLQVPERFDTGRFYDDLPLILNSPEPSILNPPNRVPICNKGLIIIGWGGFSIRGRGSVRAR